MKTKRPIDFDEAMHQRFLNWAYQYMTIPKEWYGVLNNEYVEQRCCIELLYHEIYTYDELMSELARNKIVISDYNKERLKNTVFARDIHIDKK